FFPSRTPQARTPSPPCAVPEAPRPTRINNLFYMSLLPARRSMPSILPGNRSHLIQAGHCLLQSRHTLPNGCQTSLSLRLPLTPPAVFGLPDLALIMRLFSD